MDEDFQNPTRDGKARATSWTRPFDAPRRSVHALQHLHLVMFSFIVLQVPSAFCKISLISTSMLVSRLIHRSWNQGFECLQYHSDTDGGGGTFPWIMTAATSKLN